MTEIKDVTSLQFQNLIKATDPSTFIPTSGAKQPSVIARSSVEHFN